MAIISRCIITVTVFLCVNVLTTFGASKTKAHTHQGALEPYDGKHLPYTLTKEQNKILNDGKPVTINQRNGKSGRGIVIQDIHATPDMCLSKISDLANYHKVVPNVKSIEIYENDVFADGSTLTGAMFKVGVSFVTFGYYLRLKYNADYKTYTWTLDYKYSSDFDDNTGHWQAMMHPTKEGWSRVLYSTEVKLFPWIPEFVITFLTKTALIESTTWVKRESEKSALVVAANPEKYASESPIDVTSCFQENEEGASYDTSCIDNYVNAKNTIVEEKTEESVTSESEETSSESSDGVSSEDEPHPEL